MRRLLFFDHLASAIFSLKANRMRSLLTTLGITVGIASVTMILTLASGVVGSVSHQVEDIGNTIAVIRPGVSSNQLPSVIRPVSPQQYRTSTIEEADIGIVKSVDQSLLVAPIMTIEGRLTSLDGNIGNGMVVATTPDIAKTTSLPLQSGEFLKPDSPSHAAIIGTQMAIDLFGTDDPIGQTFTLRKQTFTVTGVLKKMKNPINYNNIDFDQSIIIPYATGKTFHGGRSQIQQINIMASSQDSLQKALTEIDKKIEAAHGEKDFSVISGEAIAEPTNSMFNVVAKVMAAIAVISLIVGGIGIMNIMLVSVAERTREIGIRKAVGASNANIIVQFLVESLIISLIGGLIGVIIGILLAYLLGALFSCMPIITLETLLVAAGLSVMVGVLFGLYPAFRAASKDPIESLRHYR